MDTASLSKLYKSELLENVIPFWERNRLIENLAVLHMSRSIWACI
jgi:hypothetical protein